jgi:Ca2+-binding EF-hand superfamily protein
MKILSMKPLSIAIYCWLCVCLFGISANAQDRNQNRRQAFDPASFLQRMDANGDGALQTSEMSGRTQQFIEGLGFDTSQTVPLDKVLGKINGDKAESEKEKEPPKSNTSNGESARKVPSFRVEKTKGSLPTFARNGSTPTAKGLDGKYGSQIMERVDDAMRRYDKNSDGLIDATETVEARWGQPDPKESDLNGDGSLSKPEMAERYYRRERAAGANSDSNGSNQSSESDGPKNRDRSRQERDAERRREESADNSSGSSNSSDSKDDSKNTESEPDRSSTNGGDKNRKYADGLIDEYDANKDGRLDKEEVSKMKQKPVNADLDNDGMISAGELTEAVANGNMRSGGSSASSTEKPEPRGGTYRNRSGSSTKGPSESGNSEDRGEGSKSGERSPSQFSFNAADENGDGQVQMHEFTNQWNEEKLKEFQELDINGDGVITNAENRAKK